VLLESKERFFQRQKLLGRLVGDNFDVVECNAVVAPAAANLLLAACVLDEDSPHRLRCGHKKMSPAIPVLNLHTVDKPHISFVDQGRSLQRLPRLFVGKLTSSELTKCVVD
jgi:hypothetical protein